jgi:hypothetical protein
MKMKKYICIPVVALLMASCGGESKEKDNDGKNDSTSNESLDLSETMEHTLNANGTAIKIMVPKEYASTGATLPSNDTCIAEGIVWYVRVGEKYILHIEEGDATGDYLKREKTRLEGTGIYKLTYMIDEKDLMFYKAELINNSGQKPFYHVFGVVKIDGRDYILKSFEQGDFNEGQARKMLTSIKAIKQGA